MDLNTIVRFIGGPMNNVLYNCAGLPRPCFTVETVCIESQSKSSDLYHFGHLNRQPVYFHSRLVPKDITNN